MLHFIAGVLVGSLAATYAMLLYRNLGDVRTLLDRISRDTATGQRLSEEPGDCDRRESLERATPVCATLRYDCHRQSLLF